MDPRLRQAAEKGDIEAFYEVVRREPDILNNIDEKQFVETPLHVAASSGHTEFAMEMMRLNPSFARKPNPDGLSPVHLALLQNENNTKQQVVLGLVRAEPDLVRVKGREGETPLHYLAAMGNDLDLLKKFLKACPDSIKDVTIRNETALHIAVKYNKVEAFQVLLEWLERGSYDDSSDIKKTILNMENNEGNTLLHIATSNNLPQVVRALLINRVAVNKKNFMGMTALDINLKCQGPLLDKQDINRKLLHARALRAIDIDKKSRTLWESIISKTVLIVTVVESAFRGMSKMSAAKSNILLAVAVLIATTTYQAGLSPPGGVWQDNSSNTTVASPAPSPSTSSPPHLVGTTVLNRTNFNFFVSLNSVAFSLSTSIIVILLPNDLSGGLLRISLIFFYMCYLTSMYVISKEKFDIIISLGLVPAYVCFIIIVVWYTYVLWQKICATLNHDHPHQASLK